MGVYIIRDIQSIYWISVHSLDNITFIQRYTFFKRVKFKTPSKSEREQLKKLIIIFLLFCFHEEIKGKMQNQNHIHQESTGLNINKNNLLFSLQKDSLSLKLRNFLMISDAFTVILLCLCGIILMWLISCSSI